MWEEAEQEQEKDKDAEDLGINTFHLEGREEMDVCNIGIPIKLRKAEMRVEEYYKRRKGKGVWVIVKKYMGLEFLERIGDVKVTPMQLYE